MNEQKLTYAEQQLATNFETHMVSKLKSLRDWLKATLTPDRMELYARTELLLSLAKQHQIYPESIELLCLGQALIAGERRP